MSLPGVSVVVLSRGDARATVQSVAEASRAAGVDTEVIVVGHGDEKPVAAQVLDVFPLGDAYAANRGLAASSGAVVGFLDSSLRVRETWVAAAAALAESARCACVVGPAGVQRSDSHGRLRFELLPPSWARSGFVNAAFRRADLVAIGGFEHPAGGGGDAGLREAEVFTRLLRLGGCVCREPALHATGRDRRTAQASPREVGAVARRHRNVGLALRGLADCRSIGAASRLVQGIAAGPDPAAAQDILRLMPSQLVAALPAAPSVLGRAHRAKSHFLYAVGRRNVLHLHVNPSPRLRRSLLERESIRARATVSGIPRVEAVAEVTDGVWVLEQRLEGSPPPPRSAEQWFPEVAEWAVGMAGVPGRPLRDVETWRRHVDEVVEATPADGRPAAAAALAAVGDLRAVAMHGDLQRRNLIVGPGGVGALDWEGAWLEGLPGLDIVFLGLFARSDHPDFALLDSVAAGDSPLPGLSRALAAVGVAGAVVRPALVAMLGTWALAEDRRRARLGATPRPPVFRPLYERVLRSWTLAPDRLL